MNNMKSSILLRSSIILVFLSVVASLSAKEPLKYADAGNLQIVNRAQPDSPGFHRLDTGKYPTLSARAGVYYDFSTGLALRFNTDSRNIAARWTTTDTLSRVNTQPIAQKGLDLYIRRDGRWVHAGVGAPKYQGKKHSSNIVMSMEPGVKECLLYLPVFSRLDALSIGIDSAAYITSDGVEAPGPKVVAMGSSITHGVGVSRSGMAWPALLGRRLGLDIPNLGTSGISKLEQFYARIIADTEAEAFVFDVFSNPDAKQIESRLADFVATIRKAHPTTPLIFLQTEVRETTNFDTKKRAFEQAKRDMAAREMARLMQTDKNLYFIDPGLEIGSDHEATVDGVHPSDMGTVRIVDHLVPVLTDLLRL